MQVYFYNLAFIKTLFKEKKEMCERSHLWSMDCFVKRPLRHRASKNIFLNDFSKFLIKTLV